MKNIIPLNYLNIPLDAVIISVTVMIIVVVAILGLVLLYNCIEKKEIKKYECKHENKILVFTDYSDGCSIYRCPNCGEMNMYEDID